MGGGGWVGWVGGVVVVIFMSNPTYIKLFWVVGCVVVLTISNYEVNVHKQEEWKKSVITLGE